MDPPRRELHMGIVSGEEEEGRSSISAERTADTSSSG